MPPLSNHFLPLAAALTLCAAPALASDASDVARETRVPTAVVEHTFAQVDAFFAAANGPANRLSSGVVKELALKAIRSRMSNLDDSGPGKSSEASAEDKHASYRVAVRTTRHDSTETQDCFDNTVTATASEELPAIKDGQFTFDTVHPKVSTQSWSLGFCRSPLAGGGWSDWVPNGR